MVQAERFGPRRKGEAVQRLCWAGPQEAPEAQGYGDMDMGYQIDMHDPDDGYRWL